MVIYHRENSELMHKSMVIISNNLTRDTAAMYDYQKMIVDYLNTNYNRKMIYYSQMVHSSISKTNIVSAILKLRQQILFFGNKGEIFRFSKNG